MSKRSLSVVAALLLLASLAGGQWLERTVTLGDTMGSLSSPTGMLYNPLSGNVYVTGSPDLLVFNPATLAKVRVIREAGEPVYCPTAAKVYLLDDSVTVVDAVADTLLRRFALPFSPVQWAYSSRSNKLYCIPDAERPMLCVVDVAGDSVLSTFLPPYPPAALAADTTADRLYVGTRSHAGELYVYDCAGDTTVGAVPTGLREMTRLEFISSARKLYCWGVLDTSGTEAVLVVDADSLSVRGQVPGALFYVEECALNPRLDRLVAMAGNDLQVIDCAGDTVLAALSFESGLQDVVCSPLSGRTYAAQSAPDSIAVIDASNTVAKWIAVPSASGPDRLAFSPERSELYCAYGADSIAIVDAAADSIVKMMEYPEFTVRCLVFSPVSRRLYAVCPTQDVVFVLDTAFAVKTRIRDTFAVGRPEPVWHPGLNRLYLADGSLLHVIDCSGDSVMRVWQMPGLGASFAVLVPDLNKLYVFPRADSSSSASIRVYDCLADSFTRTVLTNSETPTAKYDPRSDAIYFAVEAVPPLRVMDPHLDSIIDTIAVGRGAARSRMQVDTIRERLYFYSRSSDYLYVADLASRTVLDSTDFVANMDTIFWSARFEKLYLTTRSGQDRVMVYDCRRDSIVDSVPATYRYSGIMNDRNDKLYLNDGVVLRCGPDSVAAMLPPTSGVRQAMAWDTDSNRVFQSVGGVVHVYRDDPSGVEEERRTELGQVLTVLGNPARGAIRLRLQLPSGRAASIALYDAAGRVVRLQSAVSSRQPTIDVRALPAGVYFVRLSAGETKVAAKVVLE